LAKLFCLLMIVFISALCDAQSSTFLSAHIMVHEQPGNDMGAKLNACIAALPPSGGICDASVLQGTQSAAGTITCNKIGAIVVLGSVTLTLHGSPGIALLSSGCRIQGAGPHNTLLLIDSETADAIEITGLWDSVTDLAIQPPARVATRIAGAGIRVLAAWSSVSDVVINNTFYGIAIGTGPKANGQGFFDHIQFGYPSAAAGGNWQAAIQIGPSNGGACCIASSKFSNIVATSGHRGFADAAIVIDSGADGQQFDTIDLAYGGTSFTSVHIKDTAGRSPEWTTFTGTLMESGGARTALQVDSCRHCYFLNSTAAGGNHAIATGAGVNDFAFANGLIYNSNQECVTIATGGVGIDISHNRIADCSLEANNNFSSVSAAANVTDFRIQDNTFLHIVPDSTPANMPKSNVEIAAGSGTRIFVTGNDFGNFAGPDPLVNGATGKDIFFSANSRSDANTREVSARGSSFQAGCNGVATSSATLFLDGPGGATPTCTDTAAFSVFIMTSPGTITRLAAHCFTGGRKANSGIFSVRKNGVPQALTCTMGTGTACTDGDQKHNVTVKAGDQISIQFTTQAEETLANCNGGVEKF
jgi:hypothetical protein